MPEVDHLAQLAQLCFTNDEDVDAAGCPDMAQGFIGYR